MDEISDNDIKKIAKLSRLYISDGEIGGVRQKFQNIFTLVAQMNSVKGDGTPLSHVHGVTNVFREDIANEPISIEKGVRLNAPDSSGRFFRAPLIIEE